MENYIKEAKNGFALDAISNDGFYPNAADAMLKLIAYNVYQGFKSEVAPDAAKCYTVSRMRRLFWIIPAILVSHARQWTLKLWDGFAKQALWITMLQRSRLIT
jgi:Transposase DDE domain group 1